MMASSLISGCHVMSDLLTVRERGVLFTLLEPHCKLIKTTVAQVLFAKEIQNEGLSWSCLGCGVICLIEDESVHSYFLRLYCVKRGKLLWEQELYIPFKYTAACTFFHTFPADDHQVGLNFANEIEAEEFHLVLEAVQRHQEKTIEVTSAGEEGSSTTDPPDSGITPPDHLDEEQHLPMDEPSTDVNPTTSLFNDLDPTMRKLLMQARLTERDLKDKDIAEAVDCIINRFGGLKAVQRELRNTGPISKTLPRIRKGPLPPVPSSQHSTTSQQTPQGTDTLSWSPVPSWIPPPPSAPAPILSEKIRKSASFKHIGSPTAGEKSDLILTALREVFRQKQLLRSTTTDGSQQGLDTDVN